MNKLPEIGKRYKHLESKEIYTIDYIADKTIFFKEKKGFTLVDNLDNFFNNYEELTSAPVDIEKLKEEYFQKGLEAGKDYMKNKEEKPDCHTIGKGHLRESINGGQESDCLDCGAKAEKHTTKTHQFSENTPVPNLADFPTVRKSIWKPISEFSNYEQLLVEMNNGENFIAFKMSKKLFCCGISFFRDISTGGEHSYLELNINNVYKSCTLTDFIKQVEQNTQDIAELKLKLEKK